MKICTKCKEELNESCFGKGVEKPDKLSYWCRKCVRLHDQQHHKKYPWKRIFCDIKTRCNNSKSKCYHRYGERGIRCLITLEEIKELWFRDKAYLMKKPSIDREDNDGNYVFSNCRFIEHVENSKRATFGKGHTILQYDLKGNFIKEWKSVKEVSKVFDKHPLTINASCRYNSTTAGFKWKYKTKIRKSPTIKKENR